MATLKGSTEQLEQGPQLNGLTESSPGAAGQPDPQQNETEQLPQQSESGANGIEQQESELNGLPPQLLLLLPPSQASPFHSFVTQSHDEEEKADSVMLAGCETPKTASSPAHKTSAMYFSTDSAGVLLQPTNLAPHGGEELDEMKLISDFHDALSKACKAGKAMKIGCEKREARGIGLGGSGSECCEEESRTFKEQYAELKKYEQHLKQSYERECNLLKEQLQAMEGKQKVSNRDHEIEILTLAKKQCEEIERLKKGMAKQVECLEFHTLQQKQSEVAKLKKWKKKYNEECEEASALCVKLAEKEKSLHGLRCQIEEMETALRRHLLTTSKDHIKQQLTTWEQIGKMVERLPNMSNSRGIDKMVEEISTQVEKMRSLSTNKRSTSWRR